MLHEILDRVPPHEAGHAFRRGRSIAMFLSPHAGKRIVLRIDLRDFFPSIRSSRIQALFRTIGYPETVARVLTGLCTNCVPDDLFRGEMDAETQQQTRWLYRSPHLPQGAPTSPAVAHLCAYRLDCRLSRLARRVGVDYTRYADDLVFSGGQELSRSERRFRILVLAIVLDEGFAIRNRKTRVMRSGGRQQVAGVILNAHCNIPRYEYDRLKALLYNCIRYSPESQNRTGHPMFREQLRGRIVYLSMVNPSRARRLRQLFDRIRWKNGE